MIMTTQLEFKSNFGPHPQYPKSVKAGIPKLSHPKNGWKTICIGQLFSVVSRPVTLNSNEKYQLVTVKRARGGVINREQLKGKEILVKSQFFVKAGDFLISKRQIVHGACGFVPFELDGSIVSNEYTVLKCRDIILPDFLNYLMHTPYFQQTCFHSSIGVHVEKMIFKLETWFKWKINIPGHVEQQKIAAFLSAVDEKLTNLKRKRELLENYNRGLMQQLFSQQIRFKQDDGSDFPDWKEKKLREFVNTFSGGTPTSTNKSFYVGNIPFIKSGEISASKTDQFISELALKNSSAKIVVKGDLLYALYGATSGEVAISKIEGAINQAVLCIRGDFNTQFLFYFFEFKKQWIKSTYLQGGQGNLSADIVKSMKIQLPCKREQQKMAEFLQSIDNKIDAVAKQITQLDTFKKGLLQKLFV